MKIRKKNIFSRLALIMATFALGFSMVNLFQQQTSATDENSTNDDSIFTIKKVDQYGNPVEGAEFEIITKELFSVNNISKMFPEEMNRQARAIFYQYEEEIENHSWAITDRGSLFFPFNGTRYLTKAYLESTNYDNDLYVLVSSKLVDKDGNEMQVPSFTFADGSYSEYYDYLNRVSMNKSEWMLFNLDELLRYYGWPKTQMYPHIFNPSELDEGLSDEFHQLEGLVQGVFYNWPSSTEEELLKTKEDLLNVALVHNGKINWPSDDLLLFKDSTSGGYYELNPYLAGAYYDLESAYIDKLEFSNLVTDENGIVTISNTEAIEDMSIKNASTKQEVIERIRDNDIFKQYLEITIKETKIPEGYTAERTEYTANITDGEITIVNNKIEETPETPAEKSTAPETPKQETTANPKTSDREIVGFVIMATCAAMLFSCVFISKLSRR